MGDGTKGESEGTESGEVDKIGGARGGREEREREKRGRDTLCTLNACTCTCTC